MRYAVGLRRMRGATVSVKGLKKRFGAIKALDGVTFDVESGEYFVVLGPVGSGRSTLLRCIAGLERPDSGDILFDGESVLELPPEKRMVGYMPPGYALFPHMTVWENVAYGLWIKDFSRREVEERVEEALKLVGLLHRAESYPYQLSGGQRQRVALARALASGARVLLLDEPLTALDAVLTLEVRREVRRLAKSLGLTVVHVTHNQEEAMAIADRVAVMRRGRVEQVGPPEEVYFNSATPFEARFIADANLLPGRLVNVMDGYGLAEVEGLGPVKVSHRGLTAGSTVLVAVRPDSIRVGSGRYRGRVLDLSHLGHTLRLWVEVNGVKLRVDTEPVLGLKPGSDVDIELDEPLPAFEYTGGEVEILE
jgi:ABC-type Fe3+/spermidine/putrescine transport system ATPase subunit